MLLGFFQVLTTLLGGFLINRFGRRPLMLIGHGIVVFSLFSEFACELVETG
jgi:MFS family permease